MPSPTLPNPLTTPAPPRYLNDRSVLFRVAAGLVLANSLVFVWRYRFTPLQDYPGWVYQGYILSGFFTGHHLGGYHLLRYPVADSVLTGVLGLLDIALRPEIAGKIVLSAVVLLFVITSLFFFRSLGTSERNPILLVPLLFIFNSWFYHGNIACLLGFSGYCLYCAYIIRRHRSPQDIRAWIVLAASCALFLTHIAPWYAAGIFTCVMAAGMPYRLALKKLLLPFVPSGCLAIWSFVGQIYAGGLAAHAKWLFWTSHQLAGHLVSAYSAFAGFLPWVGPGRWWVPAAASVNIVMSVSLAAVIPVGWLLWFKGDRRNTPVLLAATITGALVIGAGYAYGIFISPGGRLMYPAAWLGLCWIAPSLERRKISSAVKVGLYAVLLAQAVYVDTMVAGVARELGVEYSALSMARTRTQFCQLYEPLLNRSVPAPHRAGLSPFFPTLMPIVRLPYYLYIERAAEAPINPVAILRRDHNGDFNDACGPGGVGPGLGFGGG